MIELAKTVLQGVSFDRFLFTKELKKVITWLKKDELFSFKKWCLDKFGHVYKPVINESFRGLV